MAGSPSLVNEGKDMETLAFQGLIGLSVAMYLWLLAAGLTIVFGVLGVLNFAHGSLFMLGAYFAFTFYGLRGATPTGILTYIASALVGPAKGGSWPPE